MDDGDRVFVLKAMAELPFAVGKRLLSEVLRGISSESVMKNRLFRLPSFGSMGYGKEELESLIEGMLTARLIEYRDISGHVKGLFLTEKGRRELEQPRQRRETKDVETVITEEDRAIFTAFDFFLAPYTDEQKKAITCASPRILCIAGAGSGKTEVLTKRIAFLTQFGGVDPRRVLAVTFTRKARAEMESRLTIPVQVETFNSFCERMLKAHNDLAYDKPVRVISFGEKVRLTRSALAKNGLDMRRATAAYFSAGQRKGKTDEELAIIFMNDCFYVRTHAGPASPPAGIDGSGQLAFAVAKAIDDAMHAEGLRDFDDQLTDCLALFRAHPGLIPGYQHILVDEYQDVNARQQELLDLLAPPQLFCVGDPRQSIFGWRGSNVGFILGFPERHPASETVVLTANHRSSEAIVSLCNAAIRHMRLPDLLSTVEKGKDVRLFEFDNEDAEGEFVIQRIAASGLPLKDIFILARTNRQISDIAERLAARDIPHKVRSEELRRVAHEPEDAVTVATVHAIKGMEAQMVFVVGANTLNFPCRTSDHPAIDLVREDYDREEEERRLFYVALSRAKESLYVTYTGKLTRYFTDEMKALVDAREEKVKRAKNPDRLGLLKEWRRKKAAALGVAPYLIMHDKTLEELAAIDAIDLEDLEGVYGIGPAKLQRYGREIIDVMNGKGRE